LKLFLSEPPLFCDNSSTVTLAKDPIASDRIKHIEVRHCKVQVFVEEKEMQVEWIPTSEQAADIFTKFLPRPTFKKFKKQLQVLVKTEHQVKTGEVRKTRN
jgi:hypothetical protein